MRRSVPQDTYCGKLRSVIVFSGRRVCVLVYYAVFASLCVVLGYFYRCFTHSEAKSVKNINQKEMFETYILLILYKPGNAVLFMCDSVCLM